MKPSGVFCSGGLSFFVEALCMRILLVEPGKVPRAAEIIPVWKSNVPKGSEIRPPETSSAEFLCEHADWRLFRKYLSHVEKTPPKSATPVVLPPSWNRHTGSTRPRQGPSRSRPALLPEWVRATPTKAPAAAWGKPGALLAPPKGGWWGFLLPV